MKKKFKYGIINYKYVIIVGGRMKRKLNVLIMILLIITCINLNVNVSAETNTTTIKNSSGQIITYKNTKIQVEVPTQESYETPLTEFRGIWVSAFAGDISGYTSTKEACQEELTNVLNMMEEYNLNTIIFHIRTHNDAFYNTKLAPKSSYIKNCNFYEWDYLEWFINECHKRGIEFHAWMNPYRISSTATTWNEIQKKYESYPNNPAIKSENVLIGNSGAILNPGSPEVRNYLVDVCMEVIEKYDVDAIHFDDYFYIDGVDDSSTFNKYQSKYNTTNQETFRRLQVDEFIEDLSKEINKYNITNKKAIQLGISPSGVYRNGNYNTDYKYDKNGTLLSPLASNTTGYSHYDSPLYSDTKKWIDNEWIDYIIPQVYGSFENGGMPYADTVDWWSHVVKYKKVNLYTGLGIYQMNGNSDKGWYTKSLNTFTNELLYNTKYPEIKGSCLYSYKTLKNSCRTSNDIKNVHENLWNTKVNNPVSERYSLMVAPITNYKILKGEEGYTLVFDKNEDTNRYAIYRSIDKVDIHNPSHLIGFTGNNNDFNVNTYVDEVDMSKQYQYAIVPLNQANQQGTIVYLDSTSAVRQFSDAIGVMSVLSFTGTVGSGSRIIINIPPANLFVGNNIHYKILLSYDNIYFEEVKTIDKINDYRGTTYTYTFNKELKPNFFKVVAFNEFGEIESEVLTVDYTKLKIEVFYEGMYNIYNNKINETFESEE